MEIKTKKSFDELITNLTNEVLDEITTTADVAGYLTPFAFSDNSEENVKVKKKGLFSRKTKNTIEQIKPKKKGWFK